MKPDDTLEATEIAPDGPEGALTTLGSTFSGDEQAVININNLVIKVRIPWGLGIQIRIPKRFSTITEYFDP